MVISSRACWWRAQKSNDGSGECLRLTRWSDRDRVWNRFHTNRQFRKASGVGDEYSQALVTSAFEFYRQLSPSRERPRSCDRRHGMFIQTVAAPHRRPARRNTRLAPPAHGRPSCECSPAWYCFRLQWRCGKRSKSHGHGNKDRIPARSFHEQQWKLSIRRSPSWSI